MHLYGCRRSLTSVAGPPTCSAQLASQRWRCHCRDGAPPGQSMMSTLLQHASYGSSPGHRRQVGVAAALPQPPCATRVWPQGQPCMPYESCNVGGGLQETQQRRAWGHAATRARSWAQGRWAACHTCMCASHTPPAGANICLQSLGPLPLRGCKLHCTLARAACDMCAQRIDPPRLKCCVPASRRPPPIPNPLLAGAGRCPALAPPHVHRDRRVWQAAAHQDGAAQRQRLGTTRPLAGGAWRHWWGG